VCKECIKKISDWDKENLSPKDMFDFFGPPTPRRLCYYHKKIHDGLIDKPEEEGYQDGMKIWKYRPLIHGLAKKWAEQQNLEYYDLVQQGYYILATLEGKIDWEFRDTKQISKYIKRSVEGGLKGYIGRSSQVITIPHFFESDKQSVMIEAVEYDDNTWWQSDQLNPEEEYLHAELVDTANEILAVVLGQTNERESYVLWNHIISDEPQPMREIADQFHCSKDSIFRDVIRLVKLLREEGERDKYL